MNGSESVIAGDDERDSAIDADGVDVQSPDYEEFRRAIIAK